MKILITLICVISQVSQCMDNSYLLAELPLDTPTQPAIVLNFDTLYTRDQGIPEATISKYITAHIFSSEESTTNSKSKKHLSLSNWYNWIPGSQAIVSACKTGWNIFTHKETIKKDIYNILFTTLHEIGLPEQHRCTCNECDLCTPSPIHMYDNYLPPLILAMMTTNDEKKYRDLYTHIVSELKKRDFEYEYFSKEEMNYIICTSAQYLYESSSLITMLKPNEAIIELCKTLKKDAFPLYITGDLAKNNYQDFLKDEKAEPLLDLFPQEKHHFSWQKGYLSHNPALYTEIVKKHGSCIVIVNPLDQAEWFAKVYSEKISYIHNNGCAKKLTKELCALFAQKKINSSLEFE